MGFNSGFKGLIFLTSRHLGHIQPLIT